MDAAPAFQDIDGWINTDPLTLDDLDGKIVLLHFWTYASPHCRTTVPYMKELWEAYRDHGLVVIGVHAPGFDFERDEHNVQTAVDRLGIKYPVALDTEHTTWNNYGNQYWPRYALIDQQGRIREEHVGDGGHTRLEERIRRLIRWGGGDLDNPIFEDDAEAAHEPSQFISPDIYAGEHRGDTLGNASYQACAPYARITYRDEQPGEHELNRLYLAGEWIQDKEAVRLMDADGGYAALRVSGAEYTAVMAAQNEQRVYVRIDGEPVPPAYQGDAIEEDENGTFVAVSGPDTYQLLSRNDIKINTLTIRPEQDGFALYLLTCA